MDASEDSAFAAHALEQARLVAATIGDGVELRSSLIETAAINKWLGKAHATDVESANPGTGLFATRSFRNNEFITLYDGNYRVHCGSRTSDTCVALHPTIARFLTAVIVLGREEACELPIQTHVVNKEHRYCDGLELSQLLESHGAAALIGRGGGCFANDPWSPPNYQPGPKVSAERQACPGREGRGLQLHLPPGFRQY
jgi:hypothetical protein